ncbi:cyanophycinase [Chryseobacterium sp. SSA4.19]|uniref:cyanophycinase n=1 Tax=Chryseobacterium sp. SSA4.19 TaxID=2919915 RepID=UPI001F4EB5E2|nr:cyanophycinase [Chryseobacterium sp. SSA4.19]MCJ8154641.1 cyanophycinase [Chryseobacterium sp. SSA4.19]
MSPKGKLLIIGGKEDRDGTDVDMKDKNREFVSHEILKLVATDKDSRIEIITTASSEPESMHETYRKTFSEIGYSNFGFMHLSHEQNDDDISRIKAARSVFFTGGDQNSICKELNETPINALLKEKYLHEDDFTIAGTSAGAMAIPEMMISDAEEDKAMLQGNIELNHGLGFLTTCLVDTHFIHRGRFDRMAHAAIIRKDILGLGLGEDTALLIEDGDKATCKGSGMVIVINPKKITQTNSGHVKKGFPVFAENLIVHILAEGCVLDLRSGELQSVECAEEQ